MEKRSSSSFRGLALRVCAGVVLVLGLGGPSPGHTGGCSSSSAVDPVQFCSMKETYVCARECMTGRYTVDMCTVMCGTSEAIAARCAGSTFIPGCEPTQVAASACIEALRAADRLGTPSNLIPECNFCGGSPLLGPEPEGI